MTIVFFFISMLFIIVGIFLRTRSAGWLLIALGAICLFLALIKLLFDLILGILITIGIMLFITVIIVSLIFANKVTAKK